AGGEVLPVGEALAGAAVEPLPEGPRRQDLAVAGEVGVGGIEGDGAGNGGPELTGGSAEALGSGPVAAVVGEAGMFRPDAGVDDPDDDVGAGVAGSPRTLGMVELEVGGGRV